MDSLTYLKRKAGNGDSRSRILIRSLEIIKEHNSLVKQGLYRQAVLVRNKLNEYILIAEDQEMITNRDIQELYGKLVIPDILELEFENDPSSYSN